MRRDVHATLVSGSRQDIRRAVEGYSGQVEDHFELEERAYYPSPDDVDADTATNLAALLADHERLRQDLIELRKQLRVGSVSDVARAFEAFTHDLSEHEALEEATMAHLDPGPSSG